MTITIWSLSIADKAQGGDPHRGHVLLDEEKVTAAAVGTTIESEGIEMNAIEEMIDTEGTTVIDGITAECDQDRRMIADQEDKVKNNLFI